MWGYLKTPEDSRQWKFLLSISASSPVETKTHQQVSKSVSNLLFSAPEEKHALDPAGIWCCILGYSSNFCFPNANTKAHLRGLLLPSSCWVSKFPAKFATLAYTQNRRPGADSSITFLHSFLSVQLASAHTCAKMSVSPPHPPHIMPG